MAHEYDSFAPIYDLVMGTRIDEAKLIERLIKNHAPGAKNLLELGCGSGSLIKVLQKSYSCVGIDLSSEMVKLAKKKVPRCQFLVGDITSIKIEEKFDVIICVFDTINHILSFHKWRQLFHCVHAHLNQGGVFIFDTNTKLKVERYISELPYAEITDEFISIVDAEKKGPNRYELNVRALIKNKSGSFDLKKIKIPEVIYPNVKIRAALSRYFRSVKLCDAENKRASTKTEELYFICSRPLAE